jgi:hypothetical protein
MLGLGVMEPRTMSHWKEGSKYDALVSKRDELVRTLQREAADELPEAQAELAAALKGETAIRAQQLIGDADAKDVARTDKKTAAARDRVARLEGSIAATRLAITQIDEQLPEVEHAARTRHVREYIQPRAVAIVKRLAAELRVLEPINREALEFFREVDEQYPSDWASGPGAGRFKPANGYIEAGTPQIKACFFADMLLLQPGSERSTMLSRWFQQMRDAGHDV